VCKYCFVYNYCFGNIFVVFWSFLFCCSHFCLAMVCVEVNILAPPLRWIIVNYHIKKTTSQRYCSEHLFLTKKCNSEINEVLTVPFERLHFLVLSSTLWIEIRWVEFLYDVKERLYDIVYTIKYGKNNPKLSRFAFEGSGPSPIQPLQVSSQRIIRHNCSTFRHFGWQMFRAK
jgi:hypothetical protein